MSRPHRLSVLAQNILENMDKKKYSAIVQVSEGVQANKTSNVHGMHIFSLYGCKFCVGFVCFLCFC